MTANQNIRQVARLLVTASLGLSNFALFAQTPAAAPGGSVVVNSNAVKEIASLLAEKAGRTPAQRKMDSQLVHALKQNRGETFAPEAPHVQVDVTLETDGRVMVDIDANVTPDLLALIQAGGGTVINSFEGYRAIRASVTLTQLETLASSTNVNYIRRASQAHTNKVDSQGDTTHKAILARSTYGVNGSGIKVGVLSDSVDYLADLQSSGILPAVTILPGQANLGYAGEGTAMLEIVNDLAPGASLYFATGFPSDAQYAYNILNLWTNGCRIICDDLDYWDEPPFQDGIVAQAVNTVTAKGALYFSSAMNSGNLDSGTSGTWEGDFVDGGAASEESGRLHSFGAATYDTCTGGGDLRADLFWSDPLSYPTDDYDLFELDSTGSTVVRSSTSIQDGVLGQTPYESIGALTNGNRLVIVKYNGAGRFLHLSTGRGRLSIATSGSTRGHPAVANAFCVAAMPAVSPGPYPSPFTGGSTNPIETFSSDGLRRVFYYADGTAITPGNLSSTGGTVLQKPDIAAADGVATDVYGFGSFYGTSAAAPHAAAIAALLWSYAPGLSTAQIRTVLTATALDVNPAGVDRDTGYGVEMAYQALQAVAQAPSQVWVDFNYSGSLMFGTYAFPFHTLAQGVSAVGIGGTIEIKPGTSLETFSNLNKAMQMHAPNGTAKIGGL